MDLIFASEAFVTMMGENILVYLDHNEECVYYSLGNFPAGTIRIRDFRACGKAAILKVLETGDTSTFPDDFAGIAFVEIIEYQATDSLRIDLFDPDPECTEPQYRLWCVRGWNSDQWPACDYIDYRSSCDENEDVTFYSIYKREND